MSIVARCMYDERATTKAQLKFGGCCYFQVVLTEKQGSCSAVNELI